MRVSEIQRATNQSHTLTPQSQQALPLLSRLVALSRVEGTDECETKQASDQPTTYHSHEQR